MNTTKQDDRVVKQYQIEVDGGELHITVCEPKDDIKTVDVLLIHGVTASHRAFDLLIPHLPGVRIIAPDLRGRGRSSGVQGKSSMAQHAKDMVAVFDALNVQSAVVVGHSMGAFVGLVLSDMWPERVQRLVLVDGGLPLEVEPGLSPDEIMQSILGPTAQRLAMTFADPEEYVNFWKKHPGLGPYWSEFLDEYCRYDLNREEDGYKAATSYEVARDDTFDLNTGEAVNKALAERKVSTRFVYCPRGLQDEVPGLFSDARVSELMRKYPGIVHDEIDDVNHYTIVMSERGASELGQIVRAEIAKAK